MKSKSISNVEKNLMTSGSIWKTILLFALPLILGNILQQTYNTIDSMIVGNYLGRYALAAVGSSTPLINLLISFSQGIAVGCGILVSQSMGGANQKEMKLAVHTSLAIAIILGLLISLMGYVFALGSWSKWIRQQKLWKSPLLILEFFPLDLSSILFTTWKQGS